MICNEINEMSVLYLDDKLSPKKKRKLIFHLDTCKECKKAFALINENYSASIGSTDVPVDLPQPVMGKININRYSEKCKIKSRKKRLTAVLVAVVICISATVYSKPLLKTIDELINAAVIYRSSISGSNTSKNLSNEEKAALQNALTDARLLYEKYSSKIQEIANGLKTGEIKTLSFEGESDDFYVNVGKGKTITSIYYGSKKTGSGYAAAGIPTEAVSGSEIYGKAALQELIAEQYFIPVLKNVPPGYGLDSIRTSPDNGMVNTVIYKSGINNFIGIILYESKAIIDDPDKKSMESVNGMQAVYVEKETDGKKLGQVIIFLGDDKKQRVAVLSSLIDKTITKDMLMELARNMAFYNAEKNDADSLAYFKGVKGPGLEKYLAEFFQKVQEGQKDIKIHVTSDISLRRKPISGKINTYYLEYSGSDYKTIAPYCNYPLILNKSIYENCSLQSAAIIGFGYQTDKNIHYMLKYGKKAVNENLSGTNGLVSIDAMPAAYSLQEYSILDIMVNDKVHLSYSRQDKEKLIYDKNNHPYIVADAGGNSGKYFRTIYNIDGRYVRYNITVYNAALGDMDEYEFINGLEIIK